MLQNKKLILFLVVLGFIIDYIDQRYFYYFYQNNSYKMWGMTFHFSVFLRYPLAAIKWWITFKLFPNWFQGKLNLIILIFLSLILLDGLFVLGIKSGYNFFTPVHNFIYNTVRLKPFNNYFLGFLAALATLNLLSNSKITHENQPQ